MNVAELTQAVFAAKRDIDDGIAEYEKRIHEDADADDDASRKKARAYVTCREQAIKADGSRATVAHIEALVDLETADAQKRARLAEGLKRSAAAAVESRRQWLSALQSLASLTKAEAQLAAWEPRETVA